MPRLPSQLHESIGYRGRGGAVLQELKSDRLIREGGREVEQEKQGKQGKQRWS